jgi:hypothetical protein
MPATEASFAWGMWPAVDCRFCLRQCHLFVTVLSVERWIYDATKAKGSAIRVLVQVLDDNWVGKSSERLNSHSNRGHAISGATALVAPA